MIVEEIIIHGYLEMSSVLLKVLVDVLDGLSQEEKHKAPNEKHNIKPDTRKNRQTHIHKHCARAIHRQSHINHNRT